ncbi:unnamed protein product [Rhizophagus irregularis]|nr:unnamed protein product [Rhizophagus irregularis]
MVITLESFETIIRKISSTKYPTLSLVIPYIYILKNNFAPNEENETLEIYLNLVYGSNGEEEDSEMVSDNEYIPSGGTRQHWQYSHHQFHYQRRGNTQNQEYLQPVNTEGLLQKVRAAIYLFLDELWLVPSNIMLVATFLDPHFKNFDWCNGNDKDEAKELIQVLYNDAKKDISPRDSINSIITSFSDDDDDIFKALKGKETNVKDDDEISSIAVILVFVYKFSLINDID